MPTLASALSNSLNSLKVKKLFILLQNEGIAVSLGVGHYLSTRQVPCIYMQNSGFGNATDPLLIYVMKEFIIYRY